MPAADPPASKTSRRTTVLNKTASSPSGGGRGRNRCGSRTAPGPPPTLRSGSGPGCHDRPGLRLALKPLVEELERIRTRIEELEPWTASLHLEAAALLASWPPFDGVPLDAPSERPEPVTAGTGPALVAELDDLRASAGLPRTS